MEDANTCDSLPLCFIHKPSTRHNVVVARRVLVHGDQERVRLSHVNIEIREVCLGGVATFGFNQEQSVALNPQVQACRDTNIVDADPVCLPCKNCNSDKARTTANFTVERESSQLKMLPGSTLTVSY